jgi:hypothetical protein
LIAGIEFIIFGIAAGVEFPCQHIRPLKRQHGIVKLFHRPKTKTNIQSFAAIIYVEQIVALAPFRAFFGLAKGFMAGGDIQITA